jgi:membrane associated rhomboid family serine protease
MFEFDFRRTPVTLIIAAVAIALEVVSTFDPARRLTLYSDYQLGIWSEIWLGEFWRPFTTTLLHGDLLHVLFNVYWLFIFGNALERTLGSARLLGIVVLLSYVSSLAQFVVIGYWGDLRGSVGLSGVVYGLFGITWVARQYRPEFHTICNDGVVRLMLIWLVLCFVLTRLNILPVGNIAHTSGLGLGWLMGKTLFDKRRRTAWAIATTVVSIAVLSTLIACPGHPGYEDAMRVRRARAAQRWRSELPRHRSPITPAPTCSATNSRTAPAIGRVDNSWPVSASRTRGQSSDTSSVTTSSPSANDSA